MKINIQKQEIIMNYALAIDIGASGGRHILGHIEHGKMVLEEVYRFENGMVQRNGHLCWQLDSLWKHILKGLAACKMQGKIPVSVGIDTWGVDYVLLDEKGQIIGDTIAYRDNRTAGMDKQLEKSLSFAEVYRRIGIAKQPFNTLYQLMATPQEHLGRATEFLMIPDYLNYLLTGIKVNEYTNASTTGMLNPVTRNWDAELLKTAGIPLHIFRKPVMPGVCLGQLTPDVAKQVGFTCNVILPATHDTGSAFMAVPSDSSRAVYISSGTWSLLGTENDMPLTGTDSLKNGFTNEGGYQGKIRYLKNIMGMWMLQCIRSEMGKRYSYGEMAQIAAEVSPVPWIIDVADNRFLAPQSMLTEVQNAVTEQGGGELSMEQLLYVVNHSLAQGYASSIKNLEELTGKHFDTVNIVGGGSQNRTLDQMTADATGLRVVAGPVEGTALGNLIAQWIAGGELKNLEHARQTERESFDLVTYTPKGK